MAQPGFPTGRGSGARRPWIAAAAALALLGVPCLLGCGDPPKVLVKSVPLFGSDYEARIYETSDRHGRVLDVKLYGPNENFEWPVASLQDVEGPDGSALPGVECRSMTEVVVTVRRARILYYSTPVTWAYSPVITVRLRILGDGRTLPDEVGTSGPGTDGRAPTAMRKP